MKSKLFLYPLKFKLNTIFPLKPNRVFAKAFYAKLTKYNNEITESYSNPEQNTIIIASDFDKLAHEELILPYVA